MKRTRQGALIAAALVAVAAFSSCGGSKTVKIGFAAQLTGNGAYIGQAAKAALEDRVKEINDQGGIGGYKLELITYDTRSEASEVVTVVKRLTEQDRVSAIIGPEWSAGAIPLGPISTTAKVPVVTTTASNINVTVDESGAVRPYMFRTCFIDPYQGFALADFAYKELGLRRAAFLTDVTRLIPRVSSSTSPTSSSSSAVKLWPPRAINTTIRSSGPRYPRWPRPSRTFWWFPRRSTAISVL
jgi:branched-chain amino acid transport system substrate-binding protein